MQMLTVVSDVPSTTAVAVDDVAQTSESGNEFEAYFAHEQGVQVAVDTVQDTVETIQSTDTVATDVYDQSINVSTDASTAATMVAAGNAMPVNYDIPDLDEYSQQVTDPKLKSLDDINLKSEQKHTSPHAHPQHSIDLQDIDVGHGAQGTTPTHTPTQYQYQESYQNQTESSSPRITPIQLHNNESKQQEVTEAQTPETQAASVQRSSSDDDEHTRFTFEKVHADENTTQPIRSSHTNLQAETSMIAEKDVLPAHAHAIQENMAAMKNFAPESVHSKLELPIAHDMWGETVSDKVVWLAHQKIQSAELHLNPPELGQISAKIRVDQGKAEISFITQHAEVREALESTVPRLKELFHSTGVELKDVNISGGDAQKSNEQQLLNRSHQQLPFSESYMAEHEEGDLMSIISPNGLGLIDFYA